jgi:ABC-type nitrate/sulfonate/bicarbonate transport system substrate-binding protein
MIRKYNWSSKMNYVTGFSMKEGGGIMKKMRILFCLVFSGILMLTICVSLVDAASQVDIRYGGQYYPGEFLLKGYPQLWEKYDLRVEHILFSSGAENNQALISGRCDINVGSDSKTVALFSVIEDRALIIGTLQRGDRYATIVKANSAYNTWHELKGKTVGTRLGTGAEQVLRRYFDMNEDLAWEDFKWINIKLEDMIAALQSGSIEAFTAWEPTCSIAEAQGVGRVLRVYGDIALVPVSIHTTIEFAKEHRSEIVRFLAAHLDKVEIIKDDPPRAAQLAAKAASAKGYNVSADAFLGVFKRIDFSLGITDGTIDAVKDTAQFLYQERKINKVPLFRYDKSFLEEAKALKQTKK